MTVPLAIRVFIVTFIVTLVSVSVNYGFQNGFFPKWMKARGLTFSTWHHSWSTTRISFFPLFLAPDFLQGRVQFLTGGIVRDSFYKD